jgi:hypothetical protein
MVEKDTPENREKEETVTLNEKKGKMKTFC